MINRNTITIGLLIALAYAYREPISTVISPLSEQSIRAEEIQEIDQVKPDSLTSVLLTAIAQAKAVGFPAKNISAVLIDEDGEQTDFQGNVDRYPASLIKLHWAIYALAEHNRNEGLFDYRELKDLIRLILAESDNDALSAIIDTLAPDCEDRDRIHEILPGESVIRKNYPLEDSQEPDGCDRDLSPNSLTAQDAAELMASLFFGGYEKYGVTTEQVNSVILPALNGSDSQGFLGEWMPEGVYVYEKQGWTSGSRSASAVFDTPEHSYVLVVMTEGGVFAESQTVFPQLGADVYQLMEEYYTSQ